MAKATEACEKDPDSLTAKDLKDYIHYIKCFKAGLRSSDIDLVKELQELPLEDIGSQGWFSTSAVRINISDQIVTTMAIPFTV